MFKNKKNGYWYEIVDGKIQSVHQRVALETLGPRPKGYDVNHIDGNKDNNDPSNLEYLNRSDNLKHAYELGLKVGAWKGLKGKEHHSSTPVVGTREGMPDIHLESLALGRELGFLPPSIHRVLTGERNHYKGYKWRRVNKDESKN